MPIRGGQYVPRSGRAGLGRSHLTALDVELLCHRVDDFFDVIRHFFKSLDNRPDYPAASTVGVKFRIKTIARVTFPCIQRFGPVVVVYLDFSGVR